VHLHSAEIAFNISQVTDYPDSRFCGFLESSQSPKYEFEKKFDVRELVCEDVKCVEAVRSTVQWRPFLETVAVIETSTNSCTGIYFYS
jgi:hypothetical protein